MLLALCGPLTWAAGPSPVLLRLFLLALELRREEAELCSLSESWAEELLAVFSLLSLSMLS